VSAIIYSIMMFVSLLMSEYLLPCYQIAERHRKNVNLHASRITIMD